MPPSEAMTKSKAAAAKALELDPSSAEAHASMGHVLANYDWDWTGAERALLAHAYAMAGRISDAQKESNVLNTIARSWYVPPSYFAIVSIALGVQNQAFAYLNKSYQDPSEQMLYLGVEPLVDPLRRDPRFDALLKQVGLKQ